MTALTKISDLYDEFYCAASIQLDRCYELLDLQNDCGDWIVAVPNEKAAKRLHKWFDNNSRPNDTLKPIKSGAALDLMLEKGEWCWETMCGCELFEY